MSRDRGDAAITATVLVLTFAALLFVALCCLSGFSFLTAYGVDVAYPPSYTVPVQITSVAVWIVGLGTAVWGMRLWRSNRRDVISKLRGSVVDLVVMLLCNGVIVAIVQLRSSP